VKKQLDTQALYPALKKATRQAFQALRRHHTDEHFYAFALYSNDVGQYLYPTANTEEALRRHYGRRVDPDEEPQLRWFYPGDWRYCQEGAEHFVAVQKILGQFDPYSRTVSDEEVKAHAHEVFKTCEQVLRYLDAEGLFGRGPDRERIVVNCLQLDSDEQPWLASAKRLNPKSVWKRYEAELQIGLAGIQKKLRAGPPYDP
jgi:uncharacterized protein DUF4303